MKEHPGMTAPDIPPSVETMKIAITGIGERFAPLRIADPAAERAMLCSMQKFGQLTPVVVCRIAAGEQELLDGFKRLRAGRQLGLRELTVRRLDVSLRACKAAMLQLNRVGRAISGLEEALVVHSLCHEDGLTQVEIALLLGRHKSWVCRRLALIERLSDEAQQSIRLGLLPASLGAELARLQRCNQERLLAAIREQSLTWRETRRVVAALLTEPKPEHEAILRDPRGAVLHPEDDIVLPPGEQRGLGLQSRQLLRRLLALERNCLEAAHTFSGTELGQLTTHEEQSVRKGCARALVSLGHAQQALREAAGESQPRL
jgi:ParB-like chromosome segregation protein Spo0J